jgi:ABC-type dipeptide/oligopeptide/nickel transport system permease subunit
VMISSSRNYLTDKPFVFFIPGSVLVLLTLSIVLIGDGLRDALDPKLRGVK